VFSSPPQVSKEKEYIFQQTSCLPELRLKTTAVRHQRLSPHPRTFSANTSRHKTSLVSSRSSPSLLPRTCPFQSIHLPHSIELVIYPFSALVQSQTSNVISGGASDLGSLIEVHRNCKYSELKVCVLNHTLCSSSTSPAAPSLTKTEYGQRLKALVLWALDPSPLSSRQWVQLRGQADWERVCFLKLTESHQEQRSAERLKIMFDDGTRGTGGRRRERDDLSDSLTLHTDNVSLLPDSGDCLSLDPARPRLRLLSSATSTQHNQHSSPEKQQIMAKILEQRILLSRI
jgi:hypothetical protein